MSEKRLSVTIIIDDDLHRAWKAEAFLQGVAMREAIVIALEYWIDGCVKRRREHRRRLDTFHAAFKETK